MSSPSGDNSILRPSLPQRRQLFIAVSASAIALSVLFTVFHSSVFSQAYMPHSFCYLEKPALVWTHVISDTLIGLSYTAISYTLGYLVIKGRRDIPFRWMFLAFGLFIIACGGTHFVETVTVWVPVYVFSATVKIFTAVASMCTAVALPFMVPQALELIHDARVSETRRQELEDVLDQRNRAQMALRESNNRLESDVKLRTTELTETNAALQRELRERKEMESSLASLAAIVQSSDDAIVGKDLNGTIISWNPGAERIYGYKAEEVIGKSISILAPPDRANESANILKDLRDGKHVQHYQTRRVSKSGEALDISLTMSPIYGASGTLIGASAISRDISAQVKAEKALRESEAQYRLLFESSPLPMWVFDRKTYRFLSVNEAAVRQYGYTRQEFLGMTILDIRPSEDVPKVVQNVSALEQGLQETQSWRHVRKDGTLIHVEITGHALDFRGADAELILAHDITERIKSDEQLRQSQERFSKAFRASPYGITISTEGEGRYLDANPAFLSTMGYEHEEMVGRTVSELQIWSDPEQRALMIDLLDKPKSPEGIEVNFRTRSGQIRTMVLAAERIQVYDQPCVLAIMHDVTHQRQLERQVVQAQKMEAVGRLAAGIAHDFNNMLGIIIGFSEIARDHLTPEHESSKALGEIRKASDRAAALVRQLLVFTRQKAQAPRVLNLNSVIHNFSKMLSHAAGEDVVINFRPGDSLGSVRADLGQMEQVLMNLIVNARDAMPKGGRLSIETSNVELDEFYVAQHKSVKLGPYVVISVSDSGTGMDESTLARAFEPFFTTKEVGKGTGLGLSTVWGIVEQSHGHVWIYSEVGRGTTFKIYLPRVDQTADRLGEKVDGRALSGTETILVVEDDEGMRSMAATILEGQGYRVLSAANGAEALALAAEHKSKIALMLTDVIMPRMTGPALATELKNSLPLLKVLYMSGYAGNLILEQGLLSPGADLLDKPFSTQALLTKIRELLDQKERVN